jgi:pilus assembly protein Flp/PilA
MRSLIGRFKADQSGATAVEYALIVSIVAAGIIATLTGLSGDLNRIFNSAADGMK